MIKVMIADDHTIVREGLKQIVSDTCDITVADEARNGQEVLDKFDKQHFDVIILDISMPGMNGIEVLKSIHSKKPKLPVLILSIYPEEQYAIRVLRSGASGYLTKESAPDELINAIRKISTGGKYITYSLAEKLVLAIDENTEKPLYEILSDREFQVLKLIASGKTVNAIANELCLSEKTVSTYRSRILEKMKMKNNSELMHYAIQHGLTEQSV
jgi:two-component system invasion response regulator UvrY